MASAFKCDVCGRLIEGRPHVVEGWAAAPLTHTGKPRYDSIKCADVVELCDECRTGAEAGLRSFAASRREMTKNTGSELVRLVEIAGQM